MTANHRLLSLLRATLAAGLLFLAGCSTLPAPGIEPVTGFDVARYAGTWYEIARLDHWYERGLTDVTATYQPQGDGTLKVTNRGYDAKAGTWRQAVGKARFNGAADVASLKVSFFGPFYGGYHVVALDPDYQWALVAGDGRANLWILARDRTLAPAVRDRLLERARALGFDTGKLIWTTQQHPQP